ncbi:MAG: outer membrane beta-barrel protein [Acidobacteriaceae bacterium]
MKQIGHRILCFCLLLVACAPVSHAQAVPAAVGPGGYLSIGGTYSAYQADYGKRWLGGTGAYVDLNLTQHIGIEAEGRWLRMNQYANVNETTYLAGPRISYGTWPLEPYVKVLAGRGHFNFPYNYAQGNYFVVAPGGGLDWHISHHFRIRLIDVEFQDWPQFTYGNLHPYGVSAGISYQLFCSCGLPKK